MRFLRRYRPARAVKPASRFRPRLEELEDRCVPSTDMVTNLSGSSLVSGSLPFEVAHAAPGDTIQFAANLNGGTINLGNTLDINQNLTIDGAGNGITVNGGGNQVFRIEAGSVVHINALTITGGVGGIFNQGSLTLSNSTVTGNSAVDGGGIRNASSGTMTMSGDTINNNQAQAGGSICNDGMLTILNCTIAANAATLGGGIFNDGVLLMGNSTVASNTALANGDGGGIFTFGAGSQLALLNTIVFNPESGAATNEVLGMVALAQGDLFGSEVNIASGGDLGGNKFNFNPLLGPLQNNGGPTATMALLSGSPAIGAGAGTSLISGLSVPAFDQRGDPRPANSIDIGAFQTLPRSPHLAGHAVGAPGSAGAALPGNPTATVTVSSGSGGATGQQPVATTNSPGIAVPIMLTLPSLTPSVSQSGAPQGAIVVGAAAGGSSGTTSFSVRGPAGGGAVDVEATVPADQAVAQERGQATLLITQISFDTSLGSASTDGADGSASSTPLGKALKSAAEGDTELSLLLFRLEGKPLRVGSSLADGDDSVLLVEAVLGPAGNSITEVPVVQGPATNVPRPPFRAGANQNEEPKDTDSEPSSGVFTGVAAGGVVVIVAAGVLWWGWRPLSLRSLKQSGRSPEP
jgi:hypothetical protein